MSNKRSSQQVDNALALSQLDSRDLRAQLDVLGRAANRFNVIEATGFLRQELRHSYLLAYLLDPRKPHELGSSFLDAFLMRLASVPNSPASKLRDVIAAPGDPNQITVRRERAYIDITIQDPSRRLVTFIENKIDSREHGEQLKQYRTYVCRTYGSTYDHILPVFLTPTGIPPEDNYEQKKYQPVGYDEICFCLDQVRRDRDPHRIEGADRVALLLAEYEDLLRRHIVATKDIEMDILDLYRSHKIAMDLILKARPDVLILRRLEQAARSLVDSQGGLVHINIGRKDGLNENSRELRIRFVPAIWQEDGAKLPAEAQLGKETFFEIYAESQKLEVKLWVHRSVPVRSDASVSGLNLTPKDDGNKRNYFTRQLLQDADFDQPDIESLRATLTQQWNDWVQRDLGRWMACVESTP